MKMPPGRSHKAAMLLVLLLAASDGRAQDSPKAFAYVGPQYVITAEVSSPRSFVVNFINLSDFVIVVQPNEFIYRGASKRYYIGQVFEQERKDTRGETLRYSASFLLKGRSFAGLVVVGAFREQEAIEELSIRIGARRFYMEPMDKIAFESLAAKVGELDLKSLNPRASLQESNIAEKGTLRSTDGTSEWDRDWQGLIRQDGVNLPKIIERPEISPTDEARRNRTHGRIRLSALITRNGGLQNLKIEKGLGHGLDERVMEAIRNSWVFLPATRNGEVIEGTVSFEVDFPPPEKK